MNKHGHAESAKCIINHRIPNMPHVNQALGMPSHRQIDNTNSKALEPENATPPPPILKQQSPKLRNPRP